jgi:hypothetical protein
MIQSIDHGPRTAMRRFATTSLLVLFTSVASAETILNQMDIIEEGRYIDDLGNHVGGGGLFDRNYATQVADDFVTTRTGFVITEVEVGNLTFNGTHYAYAWVSIFPDVRGMPAEEAVYDLRHAVTINTPFRDDLFGLQGMRSTIGELNIALSPNIRYWIAIQTEEYNDWSYTAQDQSSRGSTTHYRDNGRYGYEGGYGHTTWRGVFDPTASAYRVEAVPEASAVALFLMLAGAAGGVGRRQPG